jgi:AcrR family transcriptional regulator
MSIDHDLDSDDRSLADQVASYVDGFDHCGIAAVSIRGFAQHAGLSRATVYRHFSTRVALVAAVERALAQRYSSVAGSLLATTEATSDRIEEAFRYGVDELRSNRLLGLLAEERARSGGGDLLFELAGSLFGEVLHAGQRTGTVRRDVAAGELSAWLIGQCQVVCDRKLTGFAVRRWVRDFVLPVTVAQPDLQPEVAQAGVVLAAVAEVVDGLSVDLSRLCSAL